MQNYFMFLKKVLGVNEIVTSHEEPSWCIWVEHYSQFNSEDHLLLDKMLQSLKLAQGQYQIFELNLLQNSPQVKQRSLLNESRHHIFLVQDPRLVESQQSVSQGQLVVYGYSPFVLNRTSEPQKTQFKQFTWKAFQTVIAKN